MIEWQWQTFDELTNRELYTILSARQGVFVVEQDCPYLDADGQDQSSFHLSGWSIDADGEKVLAAYLRVIPPVTDSGTVAIGRVITTSAHRGSGAGKQLLKVGSERTREMFPDHDLYLSAQFHLQDFYGQFNFKSEGDVYDEDGIPHIAMFSRSRTDSI